MTWYLPAAPRPDIATTTPEPSGFVDRFKASVTLGRIEDDAWGREAQFADQLAEQLIPALPEDLRTRMQRPYDQYELPTHRRAELYGALAEAAARDPETYGKTPEAVGAFAWPKTEEEYAAIVNARRRAEFDEASAVLDAAPSGSWGAEFLGRAWAGLTEEKSLITLPLGAPGKTGLAATVAMEAGAGAASEMGLIQQREKVAEDLGLPKPNAAADLAMAAGTAGLLGGALKGIEIGVRRLTGYRAARAGATDTSRPEGIAPAAHDNRVATVAQALSTGQPVPPAAGSSSVPLAMDAFDFTPTGNASPRENRVGYVFGKLLGKGYSPEVAAALTGNLMQESGIGLNTGAIGDGGNAFGMAQWNGPRMRAYQEYARKAGKDAGDLDTQIDFLDWELNNSEKTAGDRIRAAKDPRQAAVIASDLFWRPGVPMNERRAAYAGSIYEQYARGEVPRAERGVISAEQTGYIPTGTSRGYTGNGQVTAGDEFRIDVNYEVVDASVLAAASGRFQPRDRSRGNSDAWISDTAARLDPAQLMPAPTADRGAPIIGPDNMVESGNGRVAAIRRAYEQHPDRAAAYRAQIEAAGYQIPQGVERPVLVARRSSALTDDAREAFAVAAQDAGVARMTPTEVAQTSARAMTAERLANFQPAARIGDDANRPFIQSVLSALPRSERNALFDAGGALNAEGQRRLRQAFFARAWNAPDILARYAEAEDAGELKSLMDALEKAAPAWATLRAEIAAGAVRPEFDITGFVLEAMRLIARARDEAAQSRAGTGAVLSELLDDVDLLEGALSPLSVALVRKFWRDGRAASSEAVSGFLTRYADEARQLGKTGDMLGGSPADALRAIDGKTFGDLPDDLGRPRGPDAEPQPAEDLPEGSYGDGATSPEAVAADQSAFEDLTALPAAAVPMDEILAEVSPDQWTKRLALAQPFEDLDQLYELAPQAQARLAEVGVKIADDLGIKFKNPGLKQRPTVEEKLIRKSYDSPRRLTDVSRGGFVINKPEDAEALVAALGKEFDLLDEGWTVSAVGYVDRKVILRHDNGMLSEVQIWTPEMFAAKDVGTALYTRARSMDPADPEAIKLLDQQIEIYSAAVGKDFPDETSGSSKGPKEVNQLRKASKEPSDRAVWNTSSASTGTQSVPGSSMASAESAPRSSRSSTAGRPSHSQKPSNFMGNDPSIEDISNLGAAPGDVNSIAALRQLAQEFQDEAGDLEITLPDGSTLRAAEILNDLQNDQQLIEAINVCYLKGGAA